MAGKYTRSPERGFRKFAMAFWDEPRSGLIYGSLAMDVRKAIRFLEDVDAKFGVKPSLGHLLGKAIAEALRVVPEANAKIIWGQSYLKDTVDMYFQVELDGGRDLSGVVVPDTGSKTVVEVAEILRGKANSLRKGGDEQYEKTQRGCLSRIPSWIMRPFLSFLTFMEYNLGITPTWLGARPEPFGTVMLTNVSAFQVDWAFAPLVPVSRVPMVVLMGTAQDRPWVDEDGELCVRPILNGTATFDHRLLDGSKIGKIVRTVRSYMENPYLIEGVALGIEDPFASPAVEAAEEASSEDAAAAPPDGTTGDAESS